MHSLWAFRMWDWNTIGTPIGVVHIEHRSNLKKKETNLETSEDHASHPTCVFLNLDPRDQISVMCNPAGTGAGTYRDCHT